MLTAMMPRTVWLLVLVGASAACGNSSGPPPPPGASPHHLAFVGPPVLTALADSTIAPAVAVEIRDSVDRRINGATTAVTIALGANPGTATLSGSATRNAINGTATFGNLRINKRGRGYTLVSSSGSLAPDTSTAFDVFTPIVVD